MKPLNQRWLGGFMWPTAHVCMFCSLIGIESDDLRILNDQGRPFLYPREMFEVIDPREPGDWVSEIGADGERYAYPPPLNVVGFFEDFFDGQRQAVATFWQVVNQRLALAVG